MMSLVDHCQQAAKLSGRRFGPLVAVLSGLLVLAGCADRPGAEVRRDVGATVPGAKLVTLYVATNRQHDPAGGDLFTTARAEDMSYAEFTISIPPRHEVGKIEWPRGKKQVLENVPANQVLTLDESDAR